MTYYITQLTELTSCGKVTKYNLVHNFITNHQFIDPKYFLKMFLGVTSGKIASQFDLHAMRAKQHNTCANRSLTRTTWLARCSFFILFFCSNKKKLVKFYYSKRINRVSKVMCKDAISNKSQKERYKALEL